MFGRMCHEGFYTGDSSYAIAMLFAGQRKAAEAQLEFAFDHVSTQASNPCDGWAVLLDRVRVFFADARAI